MIWENMKKELKDSWKNFKFGFKLGLGILIFILGAILILYIVNHVN